MTILIIYFIFVLILNYIFKKFKILNSFSGSNHQKFVNDSVTLSGGILFFFPFLIIFFEIGLIFIFCASLFLLLGLLSDTNNLNKPKLRLFFQFTILTFFVLSQKIEVLPTRIEFIDNNFQNTYLSYFFSVFCLLILINGSNFIDGLNGLLLGYVILIFLFLTKLELIGLVGINTDYINQFIFILVFILLLNYYS